MNKTAQDTTTDILELSLDELEAIESLELLLPEGDGVEFGPLPKKPNSILVMEYASKLLDWQIAKGLELTFVNHLQMELLCNKRKVKTTMYAHLHPRLRNPQFNHNNQLTS